MYASGPALEKFKQRGIEVHKTFCIDGISLEEEDVLAETIAKACSTFSVIITDVGHAFNSKVQQALARIKPSVCRLAYYDNPESYVPGGYSEAAAKVMLAANGVLFANSNLANASIFSKPENKIDFGSCKNIGIGFYPINQAKIIAEKRTTNKLSMRNKLFFKNDLKDVDQKILVYFGGNNEEYFSKALPAFFFFLERGMEQSDFTNLVIVIQQHPGAKTKNVDGIITSEWIEKYSKNNKAPKIILSDFSSDDAQIIADGAFYYQTSMGPQFVLAGIPTVQVGHKTFEDILVRTRLTSSVTTVDEFISVINSLSDQQKKISQEVIFEGLGIKPNWLEIMENAIKENAQLFI